MTYQELLVIATLAGSVLPFFSIINLLKNYHTARKIGDLPILITPVSLLSPVWALVWAVAGGLLQPILLKLPFGLGDWVRYSGHTWFYAHGHDLHQKYGPVFIVVTPSEIEIIIADPNTAHEVTNRRKEFIKEGRMYKPLEIFGPNVDTLNGEAWQRHRRFVATPLNERNNRLVWQESLNQASDMLSVWLSTSKSQNGVRGTSSDTMTLSLHVLQSAGFGKAYSFESGVSKPDDGHTMSYKDSLRLILGNVFLTVVIKSAAVLPSFIQPQKIKNLKTAVAEFRKYMFEMIEEEKVALQDTKVEQKFNLLSLIVKLSEQEGESTGKKGLTDDELFGNLFMYNLAGHDTIANTMAYAIVLMASDLHWQEWIREELDIVFEGKDNIEDWEYEKAFPRLKRCAALMVSQALLAPSPMSLVLTVSRMKPYGSMVLSQPSRGSMRRRRSSRSVARNTSSHPKPGSPSTTQPCKHSRHTGAKIPSSGVLTAGF
jgi:cytochrome P450